MTGAFDRLRAWLGAVFGGGSADGDDADTDAGDPTPESEGRVVHRDDRPLETPGTMDRTTPPTASGTDADDGRDVDVPDAADGAPSGAATATPDTVSIPDAEADAPTRDERSAVDGGAGPAGVDSVEHGSTGNRTKSGDSEGSEIPRADSEERSSSGSEGHGPSGSRPEADDRSGTAADADDEDAAFACSVCGTAVDDPSEPCPLCRSADVVPMSEEADDAAAPTRGGRTAVSAADDDEAVDRLRDVTEDG